jgi:hypothetical protein
MRDEEKIAAEDRVIRRIALHGAANEGIAVARTDLGPEVTIRLTVCTGIRLERKTPICLLPARFFLSPSPSLPCAELAIAKANTLISWRQFLTVHEPGPELLDAVLSVGKPDRCNS